MKTGVFEKNNNNFDLIRLIAAFLVIWAHSYVIAPKEGKVDFVVRLTGGVTHSGEIAVFIFFFFSGALIFKSMMTSESTLSFMTKRFFRIYPPLVACVLFVVILGLFFSELGSSNYLMNNQVYKYISSNLNLIWNEHYLPGVYNDHPISAVNGSLWSITLEARLYLIVGIIGMFGVLRDRDTANIVILLLLTGVLVFPNSIPLLGSNHELLGLDVFPQYSITFLMGGLIYNNSNFRLKTPAIFILGVLLILTSHTILFKFSIMLFSIALAYYIGTTSFLLKLRLPADISYGIYLYGWPASQLVYQFSPKAGPEINAIVSCILAGVLATASWFIIEKPSMNFARRITSRYLARHNILVKEQDNNKEIIRKSI